jgi:hypothetical protein
MAKVGDKIYALFERNDWSTYQLQAVITEKRILNTSWGKMTHYMLGLPDGYTSQFHHAFFAGHERVAVKKTRFTEVPLFTTLEEEGIAKHAMGVYLGLEDMCPVKQQTIDECGCKGYCIYRLDGGLCTHQHARHREV